MMDQKCRILIADSHTLFREGLRALLDAEKDLEVVGEAADGIEAVQKIEMLKPDIIILNLALPKLSGPSTIKRIRKQNPGQKILVLTEHEGEEQISEALHLGVNGYCLKQASRAELLLAIQTIMAGKLHLSPPIVEEILRKCSLCEDPKDLSEPLKMLSIREKEVLKLIGEGYSAKEISGYLDISTRTAEKHRFNLMKKLNLHKTSALVAFAFQKGLIEKG
jgi:DNA-binding NarL/FixJ family response regulator